MGYPDDWYGSDRIRQEALRQLDLALVEDHQVLAPLEQLEVAALRELASQAEASASTSPSRIYR
jgi:hypothetical protein